MAQQEPMMPTTCDLCKQAFNTSRQHPRRYCSIACEEGRGTPPMDDPRSPDYHLYLKGSPRSLVGKTLIAKGLKLVDYSPDWAKSPNFTTPTDTVWCDEEKELFARKDDMVIGKVQGYDGHYYVENSNANVRKIHDMLLVEQLKEDRWWVTE